MKDFLVRLLLVLGVLSVALGSGEESSWDKFLYVFIGTILLNVYHDLTARKE